MNRSQNAEIPTGGIVDVIDRAHVMAHCETLTKYANLQADKGDYQTAAELSHSRDLLEMFLRHSNVVS